MGLERAVALNLPFHSQGYLVPARRKVGDTKLWDIEAQRSELEGEVGKLQVAAAVEEARVAQLGRELQTAIDALSAAEVCLRFYKVFLHHAPHSIR